MSTSQQPARLAIGAFSRLSALSVRMLRYYDAHGVLSPARVDPETGYRFYAAAQLRTAVRVRRLRDIGLPVSAIAALLARPDDRQAWRATLTARLIELRAEAEETAARTREVTFLLDHLDDRHPPHDSHDPHAPDTTHDKESLMSVDIERRTIPAFTAATLRDTIPTYADEGTLWQRLMPALGGAAIIGEPPCGALFHDPDYRESDVDVEIFQPIAEPVALSAPAGCREFPATEVVTATLHGSYDGVDDAMAVLGDYLQAHDLRFDGPMFNLYRVGPGDTSEVSAWVTEVCVPVAPA